MAAAALTNSKALAYMSKKIAAALRNVEDGIVPSQGAGIPFWFGESFDIPAASVDDANDIQRLFLFPPGAYIWDLRATPSDMDSGANLVYSLLTIDTADATVNTLVSASTNGQAAAGSDRILSAMVGKFVGGQYLAFKVGTGAAGGALAGTLKVVVCISIGILSGSHKPLVTDASL